MKTIILITCLLLSIAYNVNGHVGHHRHYPHIVRDLQSNETCMSTSPYPTIWSYHIHLLFDGHNDNQTAQAMALRSKFIDEMKPNATICVSL